MSLDICIHYDTITTIKVINLSPSKDSFVLLLLLIFFNGKNSWHEMTSKQVFRCTIQYC